MLGLRVSYLSLRLFRFIQRLAVVVLVLTTLSAKAEGKIHFKAVDIYVDSGKQPLAAYQLEFRVKNGGAKIVGVEGGEHHAFSEPPFYDPKAIQKERLVIAAFNTSPARKLPKGKTRVATVHLEIRGSKDLDCSVKLQTAASVDGEKISAETTVAER